MAVVFNTRPTAFGDMLIVTGTYEASDVTIDLNDFFSSVEGFSITPTGTTPNTNVVFDIEESATAAATPLYDAFKLANNIVTLYGGQASSTGAQVAGNFMAIGRRG